VSKEALDNFDSKFLKSKESIIDTISCIKLQPPPNTLEIEDPENVEDSLDDPNKNATIFLDDYEKKGGSCKGSYDKSFTPRGELEDMNFSSTYTSHYISNLVDTNLQKVAEEDKDKDSDLERASESDKSESDGLERDDCNTVSLNEVTIPGLTDRKKEMKRSLANDKAITEFSSEKSKIDRNPKTDNNKFFKINSPIKPFDKITKEAIKNSYSKKFNTKGRVIKDAFGSKDCTREYTIAKLEEGLSIDTTPINIVKCLEAEERIYLGKLLRKNNYVPVKQYVILKQFKLKLSDKDSRNKLVNLVKEVEMVKNLNNINIIKYMALHRSRESTKDVVDYSIIMEYVNGGNLLDLTKSRKEKFTKNEIQNILRQVLNGIRHLHSHHIIHHDIKPSNILVDKGEGKCRFKIADFSMATKVNEESPEGVRACAGTPWYIAPEIILGYPYSYAADIWSVGCLTFELFTGRRPYDCYDGMDALFQMVNNPSPLSACPQPLLSALYLYENCALLDFLNKCWIREPNKRPTARALLTHPFFNKEAAVKRKSKEDKLTKEKSPILQKKCNRPTTRQGTKTLNPSLNLAGVKMNLKINPIKPKMVQTPRDFKK